MTTPDPPKIAEVRRLFRQRGDSQYGGEAVTQLEHALQAAMITEAVGAGAATITAALLHDVGHLLHALPDDAPEQGLDDRHEALGEAWLRNRFPREVTEPVRQHVDAKRYLCAVEPGYVDQLSAPSVVSLALQGGAMEPAEVQEFERHELFEQIIQVRRADDQAKIPGRVTPHLDHFLRYLTMWIVALVAVVGGMPGLAAADEAKDARYLFLVTLDGLRQEELFTGAESRLIDKEIGGVQDPRDLRARYWHDDPEVRRRKLMPFFWEVVVAQGQVFGDPEKRSVARVTNGRYFSYPGYQEILCGFPDAAIDSNDKNPNTNVTVLEWLAQRPAIDGRVAAFTSWDVFPYIINSERCGFYVNAGWQEFNVARSADRLEWLNRAMRDAPRYWNGVRFDYFTFTAALEYLEVKQPSVLYLSLGETDDWCHSGRYDLYLDAAVRSDQYLRELWQYAQTSPKYRGRTSLVVTTDHGRGSGREGWKSHGSELPGSERIWIAVLGPDTPALGLREEVEVTQSQVAASAAQLLGFDFTNSSPQVDPPLPDIGKP